MDEKEIVNNPEEVVESAPIEPEKVEETKKDDDEDITWGEAFKEAWQQIKTVVHPKWSWKLVFTSFAWLGLILLAGDVIIKWAVNNYFHGVEGLSTPVFDWGWMEFNIRLIYNKGMAFGIGDDVMWARILFIIISWNASILILRYWYQGLHNEKWIPNLLWMLAWSGALGNAIDRTFYWEGTVGFSGVIDMFSFTFWGWDFAVFNFADACLVVAVIGAIIYMVVTSILEAKAEKEAKAKNE